MDGWVPMWEAVKPHPEGTSVISVTSLSGRGPVNCLLKEEVRRVRKKRRVLQSLMLDRIKTVGFLTPLLQARQGTGRVHWYLFCPEVDWWQNP